MSVTAIKSMQEFKDAIAAPSAVIDFHAEWCGPCKVISPKFNAFAAEITNVKFYSIDVDAVPDVAEECGIEAMPTFIAFSNGEKVDSMKGAIPKQLETMIRAQSAKVGA